MSRSGRVSIRIGPSLPAADEGGRGSLAFIVDAYRYGLKGCPIAGLPTRPAVAAAVSSCSVTCKQSRRENRKIGPKCRRARRRAGFDRDRGRGKGATLSDSNSDPATGHSAASTRATQVFRSVMTSSSLNSLHLVNKVDTLSPSLAVLFYETEPGTHQFDYAHSELRSVIPVMKTIE